MPYTPGLSVLINKLWHSALILLMGCALLFAAPQTYAADSEYSNGDAPLTEEQKKLSKNKLLKDLCQKSAVHHIADDDITYKPGIDAKGNFITAPDIGVHFDSSVYPIRIPLELDLLERFNLNVPIGIISDAHIAGIQVFEDGKVTYNGHDITGKVNTFCIDNKITPPPPGYDDKTTQSSTGNNTPTINNSSPSEKHAPEQSRNHQGDTLKGEYH